MSETINTQPNIKQTLEKNDDILTNSCGQVGVGGWRIF